jgi:hypothetical protein
MNKEPPRWAKGMVIIDFVLMVRVFMPIVHWVDWRFHRSQYQQAKAVIVLAQLLQVGGVVQSSFGMVSRHVWWITPMMVLVAIFLHFTIFRDYRRKLDACQRQYERRPDLMVWEQYYFQLQMIPPLRLFQLFMGLVIMCPLLALDIIQGGGWGGLMNAWVWLVGVMQYIAGCPPTFRPRREKKAWALPGAVPQAT